MNSRWLNPRNRSSRMYTSVKFRQNCALRRLFTQIFRAPGSLEMQLAFGSVSVLEFLFFEVILRESRNRPVIRKTNSWLKKSNFLLVKLVRIV